jgi:hypothetical protein
VNARSTPGTPFRASARASRPSAPPFRPVRTTVRPPLHGSTPARLLAIALALAGCGRASAAPEQPIAFPHDVHAGTYKIPCQYCHSGVSKSSFAGIPATGTCMGCHRIAGRNLPGVKQLTAYWERGESVPWVRVHDLPDFVQFTHQPHIRAGIDCAECHGQVREMKAVAKQQPLTMGWCITCHMAREAPTDCLTCHF